MPTALEDNATHGIRSRPERGRFYAAEHDHISAYALVVEDGTALARQVKQGIVPGPDDDVLAPELPEPLPDELPVGGVPPTQTGTVDASPVGETG